MSQKKDPADDIVISDGIPLSSVSDYIKTPSSRYSYNDTFENMGNYSHQAFTGTFKDLEEIGSPDTIDMYELLKQKSNVDHIIYTNYDEYDMDITTAIIKKLLKGNENEAAPGQNQENEQTKIENVQQEETVPSPTQMAPEQENDTVIQKSEAVEILETTEEIPVDELSEEVDDISYLVTKINKNNGTVENPGKFAIENIDTTLKNKNFVEEEQHDPLTQKNEELFGVNKTEVYYAIDKQIYGQRVKSRLELSRINEIKSGIMAPLTAAVIPFVCLIIALPFMMFYFKKASVTALADNIKTESSILSKIAQQKEEEARQLKEKMEDELRKLSANKEQIEAAINEEYKKKQTEIENEYKKRFTALSNSTLSQEEMVRLRKQFEQEKFSALSAAQQEKEEKISEQNELLMKKNQELQGARDQIKQAIDNKNFEIENIKNNLTEQLSVQNKAHEAITKKLDDLRTYNEQLTSFNQKVYQLISSAIESFSNRDNEAGVARLNAVAQFYNTQKSFVAKEPVLNERMTTDLFFITTITDLVRSMQNSGYYNKEFMVVLNNFKNINEYYNNGEKLYSGKHYTDALGQYMNVLKEIHIVDGAYERIKSIEKEIQNTKALKNYNDAIISMKAGGYENALALLTSVIRDTPQSDYIGQALDNIVQLAPLLSTTSGSKVDDAKIAQLYNSASTAQKDGQYKTALSEYEKIIVEYPYSSYTQQAYKNTIAIKDLLSNDNVGKLEEKLRQAFTINYRKFVNAYKTGNLVEARSYYFAALNSAFGLYANDSVNEFVSVEDDYIKSLLSSSASDHSTATAEILDKTRKSLEEQYAAMMKSKDGEYARKLADAAAHYEDEKDALIAQYENKLMAAQGDTAKISALQGEYEQKLAEKDKVIENLKNGTSKEETEKLKAQYDQQLKVKDEEIEKLKTKAASSVAEERQKLEAEYVAKAKNLEEEKKSLLDLKQQLIDAGKKNEELVRQNEENAKTSNEKLTKELADIKDKYAILEKQAVRLQLTETELKKQITEEVKQDYEQTVKKEKERLQNDFAEELDKFKMSTADMTGQSKVLQDLPDLYTTNKIVARIIEVIDTSVTFQFLSEDMISQLSVGSTVNIVRLRDDKEIKIAKIKVTYTSGYSLFGRGRIIDINKGEKIQVSDVVRK